MPTAAGAPDPSSVAAMLSRNAPHPEDPPWLLSALADLGTTEVPGAGNNAKITRYFSATTLGEQPDAVPWCSAFVNWHVREAGLRPTGSALARSWLHWGFDSELRRGAVVILTRAGAPGSGHVGFCVDHGPDFVWVLGGNQSDRVSVARFARARLLGTKWPRTDAK